ncbi:MAG TPA: DUF6054 family protein [Clostridiales bacterium]|jgi:hypothetical protein|nr:DUF6054 family protein [Clostridiales bacterium]HOL79802.1 DUF6054 family protein [Clostridiales bacterium]HPP68973.1 DUF6054 family protein [Clostridiales bacterium]HPU66786.1 DUF6054 family protein [Clostridiales bacterium]HXK83183.1 DUF6054 family protein [Clostridiales bacterium]
MAKYEATLRGDFNIILKDIEDTVMRKSLSASFEDGSFYQDGDTAFAFRVYERYSYFGNNRVSLSILLFKKGDDIKFSAITSGGSQAVFFKINTVGEQNFLSTIIDTVEKYRI